MPKKYTVVVKILLPKMNIEVMLLLIATLIIIVIIVIIIIIIIDGKFQTINILSVYRLISAAR
jgi:hypothetical protein